MKTEKQIQDRINGLKELKEEFVNDLNNAQDKQEESSIRASIVETLMKISVLKWVIEK